ncbi:MAG TPA: hypothetical protein DDZ43_18440 [Hyphomonadaceae bacterium]|nr:hypothetical protein [Ponticaulis sp.]HBH90784.1 hypothetical protein [Hyphomonadaceae bacterium]HBJ94859.1 hypothetical protein [Hyphomonadaceae bacterium]
MRRSKALPESQFKAATSSVRLHIVSDTAPRLLRGAVLVSAMLRLSAGSLEPNTFLAVEAFDRH